MTAKENAVRISLMDPYIWHIFTYIIYVKPECQNGATNFSRSIRSMLREGGQKTCEEWTNIIARRMTVKHLVGKQNKPCDKKIQLKMVAKQPL